MATRAEHAQRITNEMIAELGSPLHEPKVAITALIVALAIAAHRNEIMTRAIKSYPDSDPVRQDVVAALREEGYTL